MDFKKFIGDLAAGYRKLTGYEAGRKAGHDAGGAEGFALAPPAFASSDCVAATGDTGIHRRCYNESPILSSCSAQE